MDDFIIAFKNTSYYKKLFQHEEVLCIYIGGSRGVGVVDDGSDYDINIITLNGEYYDANNYCFLKYSGKKVHWYYIPIKELFSTAHNNSMRFIGAMQLRNIHESHFIYENPKYRNILHKLYDLKGTLSTVGIHGLFYSKQQYLDGIIAAGKVTEEYRYKWLYHLCLASYYLSEEPLDKEFLTSIKHIYYQKAPDIYEQLAIERLKKYKKCMETCKVISDAELNTLYLECMKHE